MSKKRKMEQTDVESKFCYEITRGKFCDGPLIKIGMGGLTSEFDFQILSYENIQTIIKGLKYNHSFCVGTMGYSLSFDEKSNCLNHETDKLFIRRTFVDFNHPQLSKEQVIKAWTNWREEFMKFKREQFNKTLIEG